LSAFEKITIKGNLDLINEFLSYNIENKQYINEIACYAIKYDQINILEQMLQNNANNYETLMLEATNVGFNRIKNKMINSNIKNKIKWINEYIRNGGFISVINKLTDVYMKCMMNEAILIESYENEENEDDSYINFKSEL